MTLPLAIGWLALTAQTLPSATIAPVAHHEQAFDVLRDDYATLTDPRQTMPKGR